MDLHQLTKLLRSCIVAKGKANLFLYHCSQMFPVAIKCFPENRFMVAEGDLNSCSL